MLQNKKYGMLLVLGIAIIVIGWLEISSWIEERQLHEMTLGSGVKSVDFDPGYDPVGPLHQMEDEEQQRHTPTIDLPAPLEEGEKEQLEEKINADTIDTEAMEPPELSEALINQMSSLRQHENKVYFPIDDSFTVTREALLSSFIANTDPDLANGYAEYLSEEVQLQFQGVWQTEQNLFLHVKMEELLNEAFMEEAQHFLQSLVIHLPLCIKLFFHMLCFSKNFSPI